MATDNLGRVGMVAQGDWSAGTYKYLDVVYHLVGSFMCSALTTTEEPSVGATDWQIVALDSTAEVIDDTSPQLGGYLDTNGFQVQLSKGADIASATALPVLTDGNFFDVTGTTTITSITSTTRVGNTFKLQFDGILVLTHSSPGLILPTGANITTAAGDIAEFIEYSTGNFVCSSYSRADGTPIIGGNLDMNSNMIQLSKGADVASATALPILTDGNYFDVTGTTAITSINTTGKIGTVIKLHFDGILTLTHSAVDLILPSGANITTAAGDEAEFVEYASGDFRCTSYTKADGTPVVAPAGGSMVFLSEVVASAVASADIETTFDATYDNYVIMATGVFPAGITDLWMRLKIGGTYQTVSYAGHLSQLNSGTATYAGQATQTAQILINDNASNTAGQSTDLIIHIPSPSNTTLYKKIHYEGASFTAGGLSRMVRGSAVNTSSTSALTGVRFLANGQNISGTFRLYGIAKS